MSKIDFEKKLAGLPEKLRAEIWELGDVSSFATGSEIVREGQYIRSIPLVLFGLLKVMTVYEDRNLLLYYIQPSESCIMSFSAGLWNRPSKIIAIAEEETQVLLMPIGAVQKWLREYAPLNDLFFREFDRRYEDLMLTIHQLLFDKLDKRVYDHLLEKSKVLQTKILDIRHHEIANELGTAREVVSRMIKKLEAENKIRQRQNYIEILERQ